MDSHTKRRGDRLYVKIWFSGQMHRFLLKTKNEWINGQTPRRLTYKTEIQENDRSITTATKIEIKLVVTMISPWLTDALIRYYQHWLDGPIEATTRYITHKLCFPTVVFDEINRVCRNGKSYRQRRERGAIRSTVHDSYTTWYYCTSVVNARRYRSNKLVTANSYE